MVHFLQDGIIPKNICAVIIHLDLSFQHVLHHLRIIQGLKQISGEIIMEKLHFLIWMCFSCCCLFFETLPYYKFKPMWCFILLSVVQYATNNVVSFD